MSVAAENYDSRKDFFAQLEDFVATYRGESRSFAVLLINIGQFRRFNITQGYQTADLLLAAFARCLAGVARPEDSIARIGNAEFAMLLPEIRNAGHASLAAIKIIESLKEPFALNQASYTVSSNIGIALFPQHAQDAENLFRCAELALSDSRRSLESFAIYTDQELDANSYDWDIESELQRAIEKDQFDLYFQPQVDLQNDQLYGAEALIRWQNGERGFVRPDIFIPVAENNGQIFEITQWTLNSALWFAKSWPKEMATMKVAVNISTRMLSEPEFADMVCNAISIYAVDYKQLTLEITESALVEDMTTSFSILDELKALGINISIDDFGTGYSSMAYFKNIPANELKIDQSFIRYMLENRMDQHIVETIIRMGRGFDLSVVAEGIEDQATLKKLSDLGCDVAQGYHIARPMPRDDFLEWVARRMNIGPRAGKSSGPD